MQQVGPLATPFLARIGQARAIPSALLQDRQHALDEARHRRVTDLEQVAEHLLERVQAQPDDRQPQVVTPVQFKRMSGTDDALAVGMAQAAFFGFQLQRQHISNQLVEERHGQAAAFRKHDWMLAEVFVSHDHADQFTLVSTLL